MLLFLARTLNLVIGLALIFQTNVIKYIIIPINIAIFLKNNARNEIIDLFQNNIYIVEDNNILVLGNNVNTLYKKDDIAYIKISNNDDFKKKLVIEQNKWVEKDL